jgi:hypothetical protein
LAADKPLLRHIAVTASYFPLSTEKPEAWIFINSHANVSDMLPLNHSVFSDWIENNTATFSTDWIENNTATVSTDMSDEDYTVINTTLDKPVAVFSHRVVHDSNLTAVDPAINSSDSNSSQEFLANFGKMDKATVSHLAAGIFFTVINIILVFACISFAFAVKKKCRARPAHEMIEMIEFRQYGDENFDPVEMIDLGPNSPAVN